MESAGGDGFSCDHWSSSSRRRGCFGSFQGLVLWLNLIFASQTTWAMAERNTQLIVPNTSIWNGTDFKDIRQCLDFHEADISSFFLYWPEDNFQYCCQGIAAPQKHNLSEYRYSKYGNPILTAMYYDLGLIDENLPYYTWKSLNLYKRYMDTPVFSSRCEWNDMIRLYHVRYWRLVFGKYGMAMTAVPLIVLLQLAVILAIALEVVYWRYWHSKVMDKTAMSVEKLKVISERWFTMSWKNAWIDWLHLCLLSIIGNGLVEAIGRTNPYAWQARMFHQYSTLYLVLTVILSVSSFFHQVTQWIAWDMKITKKLNKILTSNQQHRTPPEIHNTNHNGSSTIPATTEMSTPAMNIDELKRLLKRNKREDPVAELRELLSLETDWKWQPIAAQAAILFCLWAYLTSPNEEDGFSSTMLGFLVQAASPWSVLYACRVLYLTLPFLVKKVFNVKHIRALLWSNYKRKVSASASQDSASCEGLHLGRVLCCLGCCWKPESQRPHKRDLEEGSTDSD